MIRKNYYHIDGDNEFDAPFEFLDDTATVLYTDDGDTAIVGCLSVDHDCENPIDNGDNGKIVDWFKNHRGGRPSVEDWKRLVRDNSGLIFTHSGTDNCHGPGTVNCTTTSHALTSRDTRGDRITGEGSVAESCLDRSYGYCIVPDDATDPAKYADAMLSEYSAWRNGECYGVCVWTYYLVDGTWEIDSSSRDECWGYIGTDYALSELNASLSARHAELNRAAA